MVVTDSIIMFTVISLAFVEDGYSVGEERDSVSICVDSGVAGTLEVDLTVELRAEDGTACELHIPLSHSYQRVGRQSS